MKERYVIGRIDNGVEENEPKELQAKHVESLLTFLPHLEKNAKMDENSSFELVSPPNHYFYIEKTDEQSTGQKPEVLITFDAKGQPTWPYSVRPDLKDRLSEYLREAVQSTDDKK